MLRLLLAALFPPRDTQRMVEETSYDEIAKRLHPRKVGNITALLPYRDPLIRALVREAKFKGSAKAQRLLGAVLAEYLQEFLSDDALLNIPSYALVPVPLSRKRQAERGYNQAEEIASEAARTLGLPVQRLLARSRDTLPQTSLHKRERLQNVADAFTGTADPLVTYLLIDDVVTTGATLTAAADALKGARCLPIALAY